MHIPFGIVVFFPSILLIIPIILIFFKKFSNDFIITIMYLFQWGPPLILCYAISTQQTGGMTVTNVFGGVIMLIILLLANGIQYNLVLKFIEKNRCPKCNHLGVKALTKEIVEHIKTTDRIYKYEAKSGLFRKRLQKIIRYITYDLYCPNCSHIYKYTSEDTDTLRSGEQKIR